MRSTDPLSKACCDSLIQLVMKELSLNISAHTAERALLNEALQKLWHISAATAAHNHHICYRKAKQSCLPLA